MEISQRDLSIDASLRVCTFPIVENVGLENRPSGVVLMCYLACFPYEAAALLLLFCLYSTGTSYIPECHPYQAAALLLLFCLYSTYIPVSYVRAHVSVLHLEQ